MTAYTGIDRFALDEPASTGAGNDYALVEKDLRAASIHFGEPVSRRPLASQFRDLAETWRLVTAFTSSLDEIVMNPAYQQIIGLGPEVIPLILHELRREPNQWFWALSALTGADPVNATDRGDLDRMTEAWIEWGKTVRYFYD